jgi:hypothetical protein
MPLDVAEKPAKPKKAAKATVPTAPALNPARDFTNEQIVNAATGRFGEVAAELKLAEPYLINKPDGSKIIIAPLTRRRRKKLKAAQAAYLMTGAQLAEIQNEDTADQGTISRIEQVMAEAERAYDEALFGDACDEVYDYFEDMQEEFWDAMYADVHNALVNRVELPEDVCSKCGQKVESDEGKEQSSSTSSTDTGTN